MSHPFTPYTPVSALEAEHGRERVIEMAEAYLEAIGPLRAPRLRVEIPPLPPLPDVHTEDTHPGSLVGSPVAAAAAGGGGGDPPLLRTPIRPVLSPRTPPGAPARPTRPENNPLQLGPTVEGGSDAMDTNTPSPEPDNHLAHLMRTDPENPLLCPRHQHIPRGTLGPSRNSSGSWGFYGPPPSSGCRLCQHDAEDDRLVGEMWSTLAEAERRPTPVTVAATRAALQAYDEFHHGMGHYHGHMGTVERGLAAVEQTIAERAHVGEVDHSREALAAGGGGERDYAEEEEVERDEDVHYCGNPACKWDCGELVCGCIDLCRGRCGMRENYDRHDHW